VTDHHQPYIKAVATTCPGALHIRAGLHRVSGETTKAVERSHVPTRDRLRNSRGLKHTGTGQRFLETSKRYAICAGEVRLAPVTWCVAQQSMCAFGRWWLPSIHSATACAGNPDATGSRQHAEVVNLDGACTAAALHDFPNSLAVLRIACRPLLARRDPQSLCRSAFCTARRAASVRATVWPHRECLRTT
jgi:hypothetical protein